MHVEAPLQYAAAYVNHALYAPLAPALARVGTDAFTFRVVVTTKGGESLGGSGETGRLIRRGWGGRSVNTAAR